MYDQDECSFVSLRDVERAMIVFRYFCEKADVFQELVAELAMQEVHHSCSGLSIYLLHILLYEGETSVQCNNTSLNSCC